MGFSFSDILIPSPGASEVACVKQVQSASTDIPLQRSASTGKLQGETPCYWEHPALFSALEQPHPGVQWCVWARSNCT